jgi:hypothetical protein
MNLIINPFIRIPMVNISDPYIFKEWPVFSYSKSFIKTVSSKALSFGEGLGEVTFIC